MDNEFIIIKDDYNDFEIIYAIDIQKTELINNTFDKIKLQNDDCTAYFNTKQFIFDMYASYKYNIKEIYHQFILDYHRQNIYLNGIHYENYTNFLEIIYNENMHDTFFGITRENILILMCTQTFFCLPYSVLQNIYNLYDDNILTSGSTIITNIFIKHEYMEITRSCTFFIKNILTEQISHTITLTVCTTFFRQTYTGTILYPPDMQICILNWTIEKIDE
jgi:hypothetical protein